VVVVEEGVLDAEEPEAGGEVPEVDRHKPSMVVAVVVVAVGVLVVVRGDLGVERAGEAEGAERREQVEQLEGLGDDLWPLHDRQREAREARPGE